MSTGERGLGAGMLLSILDVCTGSGLLLSIVGVDESTLERLLLSSSIGEATSSLCESDALVCGGVLTGTLSTGAAARVGAGIGAGAEARVSGGVSGAGVSGAGARVSIAGARDTGDGSFCAETSCAGTFAGMAESGVPNLGALSRVLEIGVLVFESLE